jgi:hypothetical protein
MFNPEAYGAFLMGSLEQACSCTCACNNGAGCGSGMGAGMDEPVVVGPGCST